jgi:hypothetical protein
VNVCVLPSWRWNECSCVFALLVDTGWGEDVACCMGCPCIAIVLDFHAFTELFFESRVLTCLIGLSHSPVSRDYGIP